MLIKCVIEGSSRHWTDDRFFIQPIITAFTDVVHKREPFGSLFAVLQLLKTLHLLPGEIVMISLVLLIPVSCDP